MIIEILFGLCLFANVRLAAQPIPPQPIPPQPILVDHFGGLNDTDASATLDTPEAQDLLNVESSVSGTAILKRKGYSRTASLSIATSAVNGSFSFIDPNGNRQDIACHDHYCAKSTNGGTFTVFLSTAGGTTCIPTYWNFAQINGFAYGANSCNDPILQYDGTTLSYPGGMPQGSILELTKDRLVVGNITSNLNGIYYSKSGTYTNFTVGLNSVDPYIDQIGAPGDKVTGLKYSLGRLFVFKTTSITACILGDQYSSRCYPVSNTIGTNDPLGIVEVPQAIYFRGNDKNYWMMNGDGLTIISKKISNFIKAQTSGSVQNNIQTSRADFQAGAQTPPNTWNINAVFGSIIPSSNTFTDSTSGQFSSGTLVNTSTSAGNSVYIMQKGTGSFINAGGESSDFTNWVKGADNWSNQPSASLANGSKFGSRAFSGINGNVPITMNLRILDANGNLIRNSTSTINHGTAWTNVSVDLSTLSASQFKIQIVETTSAPGAGVFTIISSAAVTPSYLSIWFEDGCIACSGGQGIPAFDIDESYVPNSTGTFRSQCFDTTFSTPTYGPMTSVIISSDSNSSLTFQTQVATSCTGVFDVQKSTSSSGKIQSAQKEFIVYVASFTLNSATNTPAGFSSVALVAATTGQFQTQCIQPAASISGWGNLNVDLTTSGGGSVVFYATSAASCAIAISSSPLKWVGATQSNNAALTIATNTALVIGAVSLLTSATDQAQINSITTYWNTGVVAPPVWGTYDSIKNAIYWTSSINNSASNNRVLKYDLNLNYFYPFNLNANAIRNIQSVTYFGDSTGGYWNQYGNADADNGAAINAYWKSKDFGGGTPFVDKNFDKISLVTKNQTVGNMTVTYNLSNNTSGSYPVSLSTTSGAVYVRANQRLPLLSPFEFMNVQLGNNSTTPFEVDGMEIDFTAFPWKAQNP